MKQLWMIAVTYIVVINIMGFTMAYVDKRYAIQRMWRISERSFFILAAAGGGPGILAGCFTFRHKIRDMGFMLGIPAIILIHLAIMAGSVVMIYYRVSDIGSRYILNAAEADTVKGEVDAIIVLGAQVFSNGNVSGMLADRLDVALSLYRAGIADRILVTGDHGTEEYDEVNAMRQYLEERGVPARAIFLDHAGFDTYDSIYRAKAVFEMTCGLIVTQEFHLVRALYLAQKLGLKAYGITSDTYVYPRMTYYRIREGGARVKAFIQGLIRPEPRYLGEPIPITGDGTQTHDQ